MLCCRLQGHRSAEKKISQLGLAVAELYSRIEPIALIAYSNYNNYSFLFIFAVCSDVVTLYNHVLLNVWSYNSLATMHGRTSQHP